MKNEVVRIKSYLRRLSPNATRLATLENGGIKYMDDLKAYGYAEGNYYFKCLTCGVQSIGDKRSIACIECATKLKLSNVAKPDANPVLCEVKAGKELNINENERSLLQMVVQRYSESSARCIEELDHFKMVTKLLKKIEKCKP